MLIPNKHFDAIRKLDVNEQRTVCSYPHWEDTFPAGTYVGKRLKIIKNNLRNNFTRADLVAFYQRKDIDAETKFMAAMIWGYEAAAGGRRDGRGPWRLSKMFAEPKNAERVIQAVSVATDQDLESAYQSLNSLKWVGPNFFTKHLYFLGKAQDHKRYPLIFDDRVATGLIKITSSNQANLRMVRVGAEKTAAAYRQYLDFANQAADSIGCKLDQIEYFLFTL